MADNLMKLVWLGIYGVALLEGLALIGISTFSSILSMPIVGGITVQLVAGLSIIVLAGMGLMHVLGMKKK